MRAGLVDELILPAPTRSPQALWEDRDLLAPDLLVTALRGRARARSRRSSRGAAIAVAMHLCRRVGARCTRSWSARRRCRCPVLAPLILLLLGFGLAPKIVIVALVCFFPVTVNLFDGLRAVRPRARKLLRSLGATRWQTLRLLDAPSALPQLFTGLRVAAAVSVIGAVFAE